MSDGPKRAPSSPPETPEPINRKPSAESSFSRRMVSSHFALPPSIMISPSSISGTRLSITLSVAHPACTKMITLRGRLSEATKVSSVSQPSRPPGVFGFAATNASVLEVVRL